MCSESRLTVFFDDPFWVGIYERLEEGRLEAARMVFGMEPKDYEVFEFLQKNLAHLRFSAPVEATSAAFKKPNPKRVQRQINRQMEQKGVGTRAQQALKQQYEEAKTERRATSKQARQEESERKFQLKQEKRKARQKGH